MNIVSANLKYGMSARALTAAGKKMRRRAGIIGCQEIRGRHVRNAVLAGLGPKYATVGARTESPVFYRADKWEVVNKTITLGTKGVSGVTPDLHIVRVKLRNRANGKTLVVFNTHLVPLSLHGKPRPGFTAREAMWSEHWGILRQQVAADVALGEHIVVMGDFNNIFGKPYVHPKAMRVHSAGLDWVQTVNMRKSFIFSFATGSDHRAVGAVLR